MPLSVRTAKEESGKRRLVISGLPINETGTGSFTARHFVG